MYLLLDLKQLKSGFIKKSSHVPIYGIYLVLVSRITAVYFEPDLLHCDNLHTVTAVAVASK